MKTKSVTIIGAGLAGCEAALQLSKHGIKVDLYDQKMVGNLSAYEMTSYAELVCNNSLGSIDKNTPLGLLLKELQCVNSELIRIAAKCRVKDDKYFAVDKQAFSFAVTDTLLTSGVNIYKTNIESIPDARPLIIATGPLTNDKLVEAIAERFHTNGYHFADASSPVVDITSIDLNNPNCVQLSNDLFAVFIDDFVFENFKKELANAKTYTEHINESAIVQYEKSHSIEQLAKLNDDTLKYSRFAHLNLKKPAILLRREIALKNGFILVGCMTTMVHSEQKRIFSLIPGFEKCRFIKYGRMHRNTYFDSPKFLNCFYKTRIDDIYIIGQLSGIDGYLPAISSGFVSAYRIIKGEEAKNFPPNSMMGALANYVSNPNVTDFQPMCASFSLLDKDANNFQTLGSFAL